MSTATNSCEIQAEREIVKRLLKALKNESPLNSYETIHRPNLLHKFAVNAHPIADYTLSISQNDSGFGAVSSIAVDQCGVFSNLTYISLLTYIFDIWNVSTDDRERVAIEVRDSYENMKIAFEWESENLSFIMEKLDFIMGDCISEKQRLECLCISEALPFKGHPLHVCTKTKFGLSKDEIYRYSPEYFNKVPIRFLVVKNDAIKTYGDNHVWQEYIGEVNPLFSSKDETLFPVHPWHLKNSIQLLFQKEMKKGDFRLLPESIDALPTLSFRTLALLNHSNNIGLHIKLPVAMQATSVFRLLSERDIYNGIIFSEKIKEHCTLISVNSGKGVIVSDIYGGHYNEILQQYKQGPLLSFMVRENPVKYTLLGERLMVLSSLIHDTDAIDCPLFVRLYQAAACPIKEYLHELFYVILYLPLEIFVKYGIALDTHGQNCLIKFNTKYMPSVLIYRDLGGIQIVENDYFDQICKPHLQDPEKTILSYEDCIDEFFYSMYGNLFSDIIEFATKHFHIDAHILWGLVRGISTDIIHGVDCDVSKKVKINEYLLRPTMPMKSLLRMRIEEKTIFNSVPNPLLVSS